MKDYSALKKQLKKQLAGELAPAVVVGQAEKGEGKEGNGSPE